MNSNISNINGIAQSYNSVEANVTRTTRELREDYDNLIKENVYYRPTKGSDFAKTLIIDFVLVFLVYCRWTIVDFIADFIGYEIYQLLGNVLLWIFVIALICYLYKTVILFYCKKVDGYASRITKVETKVSERLNEVRNSGVLDEMTRNAENNQEYSIKSNNDLGREMASIRDGLRSTNEKARNIKRIFSFSVSIIMLVVLLVYVSKKFIASYMLVESGINAIIVFILAATVINVTQLLIGEYFGKYSKIVGIVESLIYGAIIYSKIKDSYAMVAIQTSTNEVASPINSVAFAIVTIQIVGLILTVCLSHYGLEKDMWTNGFSVPMAYGDKDNGNKLTLLIRGSISGIIAIGLCVAALEGSYASSIFKMVLIGVAWYCANSILKPRGSYLYTFWGRGRAIANEVVMAGMLLTGIMIYRGTISGEELIALGVSLAISFIAALVAKIANDNIF